MRKQHDSETRVVQSEAGRLTVVGPVRPTGAYVLRVRLREPATVVFGKFNGGKAYDLEPGDYAYVGSAMACAGASCLARRLARHAARFGGRPPHPIQRLMAEHFPRLGLCDGDPRPLEHKKPRWNVDHLLDLDAAGLVEAFVVCSPVTVEAAVGRTIGADPAAVAFAPGLGANDYKREGLTFLVRVDAGEAWWGGLSGRLWRAQAAEAIGAAHRQLGLTDEADPAPFPGPRPVVGQTAGHARQHAARAVGRRPAADGRRGIVLGGEPGQQGGVRHARLGRGGEPPAAGPGRAAGRRRGPNRWRSASPGRRPPAAGRGPRRRDRGRGLRAALPAARRAAAGRPDGGAAAIQGGLAGRGRDSHAGHGRAGRGEA